MKKISDSKIFTRKSKAFTFHMKSMAWQPFDERGITRAGLEQVQDLFQTAWIRNSYGLVFMVRTGRYLMRTVDGEREFGPGHAALVPPDTYRQLKLLDDYGEHIFIHITGLARWAAFFADGTRVKALNSMDELFEIAWLYLKESRDSLRKSELIASRLAETFLLCLQREADWNMTTLEIQHIERMDELWEEVAARPEYRWTIAQMAKKLCVTPGHFHVLCRKLSGVAPIEKVIEIRMEKACSLLQRTNDPLPLIAEAVGYESVCSFSRLFKKHIGIRPGQYRKETK